MDYQNTTPQEVMDRWQELSKDYKEKKSEFVDAWKRFMSDCDSRDRKAQERKADLSADKQAFDQQLESLGGQYTAFMLEGQEEEAAAIKQQMAEITSKRQANEALINSVDKVTYSEKLLHAADKAFDEYGIASMALNEKKAEFMDAIESMKKVLEDMDKAIMRAGDGTAEGQYHFRMHRRFNHQPEEN